MRAGPAAWGWTEPARRLLVAVAIAAGSCLLVAGLSDHEGRAPLPDLVVDINHAPVELLQSLPQIGPSRAGAIVEARRQAPFATIHDLDARVEGIGPVTAAILAPLVRFRDDGAIPASAPGPSDRRAPRHP